MHQIMAESSPNISVNLTFQSSTHFNWFGENRTVCKIDLIHRWLSIKDEQRTDYYNYISLCKQLSEIFDAVCVNYTSGFWRSYMGLAMVLLAPIFSPLQQRFCSRCFLLLEKRCQEPSKAQRFLKVQVTKQTSIIVFSTRLAIYRNSYIIYLYFCFVGVPFPSWVYTNLAILID